MPAEFTGSIAKSQEAFIKSGGIGRYGKTMAQLEAEGWVVIKGSFLNINQQGNERMQYETVALRRIAGVMGELAGEIIFKARDELEKIDKIATGNLFDSFLGVVTPVANGFSLEIMLADYYDYVNQGVQGSDPSKSINRTSPYKYTGNYYSIPVGVIYEWLRRNGSMYRNDKYEVAKNVYGRKMMKADKLPEDILMARAMRIARAIYLRGLKYTGYWDKAVKGAKENLRERLTDLGARVIEAEFRTALTKDKNK